MDEYFLKFILGSLLIFAFIILIKKPSNERDWSLDQMILPHAQINGNLVKIFDIRDFIFTGEFDFKARYYDKTFDLNKINKAYYVLVPFSAIKGIAHAFLSFEFENNEFVSISIEIRKKHKDKYHPIKGMFRQYEIMYVIGSEFDLIRQRSEFRKNKVYLYPLKIEKEKVKEIFLSMIKRVNRLKEKPEFYNTFTNACAINIIKHANEILDKKLPLSFSALMPEFSDRLAYKSNLIDTDLPFKKVRSEFLINKRAEGATEENFSTKIRGRA